MEIRSEGKLFVLVHDLYDERHMKRQLQLFSSLQPCTESFYLTLFSQYRTDMIADLTKFIRKAQEITLHDGSDIKDIFLKDAIYKAAGLSAFNLFDEVST